MSALGLIGECMLEMRQHDDSFLLGYGGDVFNTAVYAARLGLAPSFLTSTGDDHYSQYLINAWIHEGVDTGSVRIHNGATPSLYIIQTDNMGERTFHYWREASPFRHWLSPGPYLDRISETLKAHDNIYYSGITLGLLPAQDREVLFGLLQNYRRNGGRVAFDPNYRAKLWDNVEDAKHWIDEAYSNCDIAMPSLDDESVIRGERSEQKLIDHVHGLGAGEIVLKDGPVGATVSISGRRHSIAANIVSNVIDTTAAGDSFNGAYLAFRLTGNDASTSAERGCEVAAQVIQHRGAIIPREIKLINT